MSARFVSLLLAAVVLVLELNGPPAACSAEGDAIKVDLKSFKFKVPEAIASLFGYDEGQGRLFYYGAAPGETTVKLPADGEYELVIRASCDPALNERAKFKVSLDGQPVGMETLLTDDGEKDYTLKASAKMGERKLEIEYTNDAYKENEYDRNFYVYGVSLKKVK